MGTWKSIRHLVAGADDPGDASAGFDGGFPHISRDVGSFFLQEVTTCHSQQFFCAEYLETQLFQITCPIPWRISSTRPTVTICTSCDQVPQTVSGFIRRTFYFFAAAHQSPAAKAQVDSVEENRLGDDNLVYKLLTFRWNFSCVWLPRFIVFF